MNKLCKISSRHINFNIANAVGRIVGESDNGKRYLVDVGNNEWLVRKHMVRLAARR